MPHPKALILPAAVVLAAVSACGAPPGDPGRATTTAVSTLPPASSPAAATTTASSATSSRTAALVKVPDVSGMNHQDAQDTMQKAGLYNLREVDGTGQHRLLLIDRNWVQTGQTPAPGTEVAPDAVITLTAIKYTDR